MKYPFVVGRVQGLDSDGKSDDTDLQLKGGYGYISDYLVPPATKDHSDIVNI